MAQDEARALNEYEQASALDRAGQEAGALPHYQRALALGLPQEHRRGALLGLGSTLRNLGRIDESVAILEQAVQDFPDDAALKAFLALALWSRGEGATTVAMLLDLAVRHAPVGEYKRSLTQYAEDLRRSRPG